VKAPELFRVEGLATLVTGGASGIGLAIAGVMADNGARVTLIDVNAAAMRDAVRTLSAGGAEVHGEAADVTDKDALECAVAAAVRRTGRLDVVFANAGISGGPGFLTGDDRRNAPAALENLSEELWDRVIETNLSSVFKTLQAVVPRMKAQGGGSIVVTGSISGLRTELYVGTPYVASKAGVAQLVRQAARELARYNVRVNAIAPGPVITNIAGGRLQDPTARAPFERGSPMRRIATPQDLCGAALFLASPAARFITGASIVVDGGATLGAAD
jgi:NAD(P)-dependent dehydrogenase (short-subunit alcohol dehydrogenase family)